MRASERERWTPIAKANTIPGLFEVYVATEFYSNQTRPSVILVQAKLSCIECHFKLPTPMFLFWKVENRLETEPDHENHVQGILAGVGALQRCDDC